MKDVNNDCSESDKILIFRHGGDYLMGDYSLPGIMLRENEYLCVAKTEKDALQFAQHIWEQYRRQCVIVMERNDDGEYFQPDIIQWQEDRAIDY